MACGFVKENTSNCWYNGLLGQAAMNGDESCKINTLKDIKFLPGEWMETDSKIDRCSWQDLRSQFRYKFVRIKQKGREGGVNRLQD